MRLSLSTRSMFVVVCGALAMALQVAGSAQDKPLPPAYPRPGTTLLLENSRVQVWNIAWLKQRYPLHRHRFDLIGVYYTPGDRSIVAADGSRRPVSTKAWETASQKSGVTHVEEGTSDSPLRAVFVEMKEPSAKDASGASSDFSKVGGVQRLDNERATLWEFAPPGSGTHRHVRDAVAVAFTGTTPGASFVPAGTVHDSDAPGRPDRVYIVELK